MTWEELKTDDRYSGIYTYTADQLAAMEAVAVGDGEILQPLVSWDQTLIWGYPYREILKQHPNLKYHIVEKTFDSWEEAKVWAVEHYICLPEILLAQKLQAAIQCETYWRLKAAAKEAQGKRNDITSEREGKSESKMVDAIIARKVGCCETYVYNFKRILGCGNDKIIDQLLKGNLTISAAYARLFSTNTKKGKNTSRSSAEPSIELDIDDVDIIEEAGEDDSASKRKPARIPVDPLPVARNMTTCDVPDGSLWIAVYLQEGQLHIAKRTHDEEKGSYKVKVNCFDCRLVSKSNDMIILEANHIRGAIEEFHTKDDLGFEETCQRQAG